MEIIHPEAILIMKFPYVLSRQPVDEEVLKIIAFFNTLMI